MTRYLEFDQIVAIAKHFLERRSDWEWKHCVSVSDIAFQFSLHLKKSNENLLTDDQCQILRKAGLLHDVGKIEMDKVMAYLPPEAITEIYLNQIHEHPIHGMQFLEKFYDDTEIIRLVAGHHCRLPHLSGGAGQKDYGYPPEYCKTIQMDLLLSVLVLSDIYDTVAITQRSYTFKRPKAAALIEIRHMALRGALDKDVTEWFCNWAENHG